MAPVQDVADCESGSTKIDSSATVDCESIVYVNVCPIHLTLVWVLCRIPLINQDVLFDMKAERVR